MHVTSRRQRCAASGLGSDRHAVWGFGVWVGGLWEGVRGVECGSLGLRAKGPGTSVAAVSSACQLGQAFPCESELYLRCCGSCRMLGSVSMPEMCYVTQCAA